MSQDGCRTALTAASIGGAAQARPRPPINTTPISHPQSKLLTLGVSCYVLGHCFVQQLCLARQHLGSGVL